MNEGATVRQDSSEATALKQVVHRLTWISIAAAIAFCFFASSICITLVLAAFLSILVNPVVRALEKLRLPRSFAAALVILAGMIGFGLLLYGSVWPKRRGGEREAVLDAL
jgi:predicted PurR-regulated permease PerM